MIKYSYGSDRHSYGCASKRITPAIQQLQEVQKRLERVVIEHKDFESIIKTYDRPGALFYCDPPYVGTEFYYDEDFKWTDHERLFAVLKDIKGRFLLSYNDAPNVRDLYKDFNIKEISRSSNLVARYKPASYSELLISNYETTA